MMLYRADTSEEPAIKPFSFAKSAASDDNKDQTADSTKDNDKPAAKPL